MKLTPVTAKEMKEIERQAYENGTAYIEMMENAGHKAVEEFLKNYKTEETVVAVVTGKGNNGGDGFVAARILKEKGIPAFVIMIDGKPVTDDAYTSFEKCIKSGVEVLNYDTDKSKLLLNGADYIFDAVYGSGFHGQLNGNAASAAREINECDGKVISFDLPSGINADTGECADECINADMTIAFARMKKAHTIPEALMHCGRIILTDIGI